MNGTATNSEIYFSPPQPLTPFLLAANFVIPPTLLKWLRLGNRPATMSDHAHIRVWPRTARPLGVRPQELLSCHPASFGRFGLIPSHPSATPENPAISLAKICKKPCKTPLRQPSSTVIFFLRSSPPSRACHPTLPAMGNGGGAAQLRGETWTAAVSRPARDQPQRVGSSSRIEYFRRSHSCEAAAAGLRHSRGPGAGPATECGRNPNGSGRFALPTQSGTRTELPDTSSLRGASWRMRCAK
jgi:hypothetical protein